MALKTFECPKCKKRVTARATEMQHRCTPNAAKLTRMEEVADGD